MRRNPTCWNKAGTLVTTVIRWALFTDCCIQSDTNFNEEGRWLVELGIFFLISYSKPKKDTPAHNISPM